MIDKPQTFIERLRNKFGKYIDNFSTNIRRNSSRLYVGLFLFSCVFYAVVYTSTFFNPKLLAFDSDVIAVEKIFTSNSKITLRNREYNQQTGILALHVQYVENSSATLVTPTLSFKNQFQGETSENVETVVVKIDRTNYMVYITGLKTWKAARLQVYSDDIVDESTVYLITKNDDTLIKNDALVIQDERNLLIQTLELKIKNYQLALNELDAEKQKLEKEIVTYREEIKKIEQEKLTQTQSEKEKSNQRIATVQAAITKNNDAIKLIPSRKQVIQKEQKETEAQLKTLKK